MLLDDVLGMPLYLMQQIAFLFAVSGDNINPSKRLVFNIMFTALVRGTSLPSRSLPYSVKLSFRSRGMPDCVGCQH